MLRDCSEEEKPPEVNAALIMFLPSDLSYEATGTLGPSDKGMQRTPTSRTEFQQELNLSQRHSWTDSYF